jgi:hypothetical protein
MVLPLLRKKDHDHLDKDDGNEAVPGGLELWKIKSYSVFIKQLCVIYDLCCCLLKLD